MVTWPNPLTPNKSPGQADVDHCSRWPKQNTHLLRDTVLHPHPSRAGIPALVSLLVYFNKQRTVPRLCSRWKYWRWILKWSGLSPRDSGS